MLLTDATATDQLRDVAARLGSCLSTETVSSDVPACPGWGVGRLVSHVGTVHRVAAGRVGGTTPDRSRPSLDDAGVLGSWWAEGVDLLLATFASADLDVVVDTFWGPNPGRFWLRRMVHETTIHCHDGEVAVGRDPVAIPGMVAIDGIDEALTAVLPLMFDRSVFGGQSATVHLHVTDSPADVHDGAGEWLASIEAGAYTVERTHAKGDVAVRGRAEDLNLLVWGRLGVDDPRFEIFGDASLAERFFEGCRI